MLFNFNSFYNKFEIQSSNGYFRTYIHYPRQLIRSLDRPTYELSFKNLDSQHAIDASLTVSFVSVLKKRSDANKKCNASLIDDDNEFKIRIIQQIGCVPVYWMQMIDSPLSLKHCNNITQYQQINSLISNSTDFMTSYDQPCIELMAPVNVKEGRGMYPGKPGGGMFLGGYLMLTIPYTTETFQEIKNVKDFGFETLWSSAGGLVGIFLGCSLLQVPELFEVDLKGYWTKMMTLFSYLITLYGVLAARLTNKGSVCL